MIRKPFEDRACDIILIDMPEEYAKIASRHYESVMSDVPLIALGYYSSRNKKPDFIINLDRIEEDVEPGANYYSGLEYGIIRESFFEYRDISRSDSDYLNIMISMGGADTMKTSELLVNSLGTNLNSYSNFRYNLILGPLSEKFEHDSKCLKIKIYRAPNNMERLMSEADLAICNGGTTMLEYAFLGKPIIAIPQTYLEEVFIRKFENEGTAILVKCEGIENDLCSILLELANNPEKRDEISRAGKKLIDGKGKNRIISIIKEAVNGTGQ